MQIGLPDEEPHDPAKQEILAFDSKELCGLVMELFITMILADAPILIDAL